MERLEREDPLPAVMQGHWQDVDDAGAALIINGGEVRHRGQAIPYDYKLVGVEEDAVVASLEVSDHADEDEFQRSYITELVITPKGELHGYNVKFASQFVRTS